MADGYRGVFGAVPFAFRRSDSWLFRSYVLVSTLAALGISLLVIAGLVFLIGRTAAATGGSLTISRAFYVVVGLFLVAPVVAPTLLVARRHRRGLATARRYDATLAVAGYLFLVSLYVGLVVTVPPAQQQPLSGPLAPVVAMLYALPAAYGLVPPLVAASLIALVHRALSR
jgi:hypothetical protein